MALTPVKVDHTWERGTVAWNSWFVIADSMPRFDFRRDIGSYEMLEMIGESLHRVAREEVEDET